MRGFDPSAYGTHIADIYDDTVRHIPTDEPVSRLAELAGDGSVLEFGIGTGRLALPLAARGLTVAGIDGSAEMVGALRAKPGGADLEVAIGDFSEVRVAGEFAVVVLAVNTIFALPDQQAQVRCFRNAAAHLRPGGRFVVEAWIPDPGAFRSGTALRPLVVGEEEVLLEVAVLHPAEQRMDTTKLRFTGDGVRLLPANHRYAWPAELDLMAQLAGMTREDRWEDWSGTPFGDTSRQHVTVYRLDHVSGGGQVLGGA
jgi:SAM-dependent methyltransferase